MTTHINWQAIEKMYGSFANYFQFSNVNPVTSLTVPSSKMKKSFIQHAFYYQKKLLFSISCFNFLLFLIHKKNFQKLKISILFLHNNLQTTHIYSWIEALMIIILEKLYFSRTKILHNKSFNRDIFWQEL